MLLVCFSAGATIILLWYALCIDVNL